MITECPAARHLFIAVPTSDARVSAETMVSTTVGAVLLERAGIISEIRWETAAPEWHVRNILVKRFLDSTASDLLFLDADVGSDPAAIVRIAQVRRPLVVGVYPIKTNDADRWPVKFSKLNLTSDKDGLLTPDAGPTGFMRINRGVFGFLDYEPYTYQTANGEYEEVRGFFTERIINGKKATTDFEMCQRWVSLGGKVHMIPDIDFTHSGIHRWSGNWSSDHRSSV